MHPPRHICEGLYRKNKQFRLGWMGEADAFAVLRLIPARLVGRRDDPETFGSFWDCAVVANEYGGFDTLKHYSGPIFNRYGGVTPDWDITQRVPIIVDVADRPGWLDERDIVNGAFVKRFQVVSQRQVRADNAKILLEQGMDAEARVKDLAADSQARVMHGANQSSDVGVIMARKHQKADFGKFEEQAEKTSDALNFTVRFLKKSGYSAKDLE